ncbi:unnamed protein product [Chrysoparadoxa australica]
MKAREELARMNQALQEDITKFCTGTSERGQSQKMQMPPVTDAAGEEGNSDGEKAAGPLEEARAGLARLFMENDNLKEEIERLTGELAVARAETSSCAVAVAKDEVEAIGILLSKSEQTVADLKAELSLREARQGEDVTTEAEVLAIGPPVNLQLLAAQKEVKALQDELRYSQSTVAEVRGLNSRMVRRLAMECEQLACENDNLVDANALLAEDMEKLKESNLIHGQKNVTLSQRVQELQEGQSKMVEELEIARAAAKSAVDESSALTITTLQEELAETRLQLSVADEKSTALKTRLEEELVESKKEAATVQAKAQVQLEKMQMELEALNQARKLEVEELRANNQMSLDVLQAEAKHARRQVDAVRTATREEMVTLDLVAEERQQEFDALLSAKTLLEEEKNKEALARVELEEHVLRLQTMMDDKAGEGLSTNPASAKLRAEAAVALKKHVDLEIRCASLGQALTEKQQALEAVSLDKEQAEKKQVEFRGKLQESQQELAVLRLEVEQLQESCTAEQELSSSLQIELKEAQAHYEREMSRVGSSQQQILGLKESPAKARELNEELSTTANESKAEASELQGQQLSSLKEAAQLVQAELRQHKEASLIAQERSKELEIELEKSRNNVVGITDELCQAQRKLDNIASEAAAERENIKSEHTELLRQLKEDCEAMKIKVRVAEEDLGREKAAASVQLDELAAAKDTVRAMESQLEQNENVVDTLRAEAAASAAIAAAALEQAVAKNLATEAELKRVVNEKELKAAEWQQAVRGEVALMTKDLDDMTEAKSYIELEAQGMKDEIVSMKREIQALTDLKAALAGKISEMHLTKSAQESKVVALEWALAEARDSTAQELQAVKDDLHQASAKAAEAEAAVVASATAISELKESLKAKGEESAAKLQSKEEAVNRQAQEILSLQSQLESSISSKQTLEFQLKEAMCSNDKFDGIKKELAVAKGELYEATKARTSLEDHLAEANRVKVLLEEEVKKERQSVTLSASEFKVALVEANERVAALEKANRQEQEAKRVAASALSVSQSKVKEGLLRCAEAESQLQKERSNAKAQGENHKQIKQALAGAMQQVEKLKAEAEAEREKRMALMMDITEVKSQLSIAEACEKDLNDQLSQDRGRLLEASRSLEQAVCSKVHTECQLKDVQEELSKVRAKAAVASSTNSELKRKAVELEQELQVTREQLAEMNEMGETARQETCKKHLMMMKEMSEREASTQQSSVKNQVMEGKDQGEMLQKELDDGSCRADAFRSGEEAAAEAAQDAILTQAPALKLIGEAEKARAKARPLEHELAVELSQANFQNEALQLQASQLVLMQQLSTVEAAYAAAVQEMGHVEAPHEAKFDGVTIKEGAQLRAQMTRELPLLSSQSTVRREHDGERQVSSAVCVSDSYREQKTDSQRMTQAADGGMPIAAVTDGAGTPLKLAKEHQLVAASGDRDTTGPRSAASRAASDALRALEISVTLKESAEEEVCLPEVHANCLCIRPNEVGASVSPPRDGAEGEGPDVVDLAQRYRKVDETSDGSEEELKQVVLCLQHQLAEARVQDEQGFTSGIGHEGGQDTDKRVLLTNVGQGHQDQHRRELRLQLHEPNQSSQGDIPELSMVSGTGTGIISSGGDNTSSGCRSSAAVERNEEMTKLAQENDALRMLVLQLQNESTEHSLPSHDGEGQTLPSPVVMHERSAKSTKDVSDLVSDPLVDDTSQVHKGDDLDGGKGVAMGDTSCLSNVEKQKGNAATDVVHIDAAVEGAATASSLSSGGYGTSILKQKRKKKQKKLKPSKAPVVLNQKDEPLWGDASVQNSASGMVKLEPAASESTQRVEKIDSHSPNDVSRSVDEPGIALADSDHCSDTGGDFRGVAEGMAAKSPEERSHWQSLMDALRNPILSSFSRSSFSSSLNDGGGTSGTTSASKQESSSRRRSSMVHSWDLEPIFEGEPSDTSVPRGSTSGEPGTKFRNRETRVSKDARINAEDHVNRGRELHRLSKHESQDNDGRGNSADYEDVARVAGASTEAGAWERNETSRRSTLSGDSKNCRARPRTSSMPRHEHESTSRERREGEGRERRERRRTLPSHLRDAAAMRPHGHTQPQVRRASRSPTSEAPSRGGKRRKSHVERDMIMQVHGSGRDCIPINRRSSDTAGGAVRYSRPSSKARTFSGDRRASDSIMVLRGGIVASETWQQLLETLKPEPVKYPW